MTARGHPREARHETLMRADELVSTQSLAARDSIQSVANVRIDSQFQWDDPSRVTGAVVTFESGARTAWYTHRSDRRWLSPAVSDGFANGRFGSGNEARRCRVDSAGCEALARRKRRAANDSYRY